MVARSLLALASTFVALALGGEAFFRVVRPVEYRRPTTEREGTLWKSIVHRRSTLPGLDYEMKPHVHRTLDGMTIDTNALGMRDDEVRTERGPADVRIAVVGDSVTFGMKVSGEEAWPNALERRLNEGEGADGRVVEVLNLGVSGYSTQDEAIVVRHVALPLRPRLLVIGYYLNDPETEPVQQLHQHFRRAETWEHSALLRWLAFQRRLHDMERLGGGDVFRYLHRDPEHWRSVVAALEDMAEATAREDVRVLFVVLPTLRGYPSFEAYPYEDLHEQAIAAARKVGFETFDALPAWRASGRTPQELRADGEHPNAEGHRLIAEAILGKLRSTPRLLEGPRVARATARSSSPPAR